MSTFNDAYKRFKEATNTDYPITYEEWLAMPEEHKAAALFVQFYEQITLAWAKARSECIDDEDGISTLMQYLMKNVQVLKDNPKKFTEGYIYRVAYNSMGCLRRVQRERDRINFTVSQYTEVNGDTLDLFDIIEDEDSISASMIEKVKMEMRNIILNMDRDTISVVEHLLGDKKNLNKRVAKKESDILADLRKTFAKYRSTIMPEANQFHTFKEVLAYDDIIESATVIMRDGVKAVYCGEKRISPITKKTEIVFFGPDMDYVLPVSIAGELLVTDVDIIGE